MGITATRMLTENNATSVHRIYWICERRKLAITNSNYDAAFAWDRLLERAMDLYLQKPGGPNL